MTSSKRQILQKPVPANLSYIQMQEAFAKIDRRLGDLRAFDCDSIVSRSDPKIESLAVSLDLMFESIFGYNTIEYEKYRGYATIDTAGYNIYGTPIHEVVAGIKYGIERAVATIETIKKNFQERLDDAGKGQGVGSVIKAYEGLHLHPEIERAASQLFKDGHYASAVEDSVKVLNDLVRLRSGETEDGDALMRKVFSPNNPILQFNALTDQSDTSEQRGYMDMFAGAVTGIRNPRAHKIIKDDPERALEFIAFVSLLVKLLDGTKKRNCTSPTV